MQPQDSNQNTNPHQQIPQTPIPNAQPLNQPLNNNQPFIPPSESHLQTSQNPYPQPSVPAAQMTNPGEGDKSFVGTFILSWLFGSLGVDRFYVGKIGTGILKLITIGGLGLWVTIDLIMITFGKFRDKQGKKLHDYEKNKGWAKVVGTIIIFVDLIALLIITALIITTTASIGKKAADSERQTDIQALHGSLNAYYGNTQSYPSLDQINDEAWRTTNFASLDAQFFIPPNSSSNKFAQFPTADQYGYDAKTDTGLTCDGTKIKCAKYSLSTKLQQGGEYVKTNLNN